MKIMKIVTLLSLVFVTLVSCNCQKKVVNSNTISTNEKIENNTMELVYEANSRGFYQKIIVLNQELFVSKDRNSKDKGEIFKISIADWQELVEYMNNLKLDALSSYKDPTQKRFYDGAAIANLKITFKDKKYESQSFDHGFPPAEIEKLVNKINSFVKTQ